MGRTGRNKGNEIQFKPRNFETKHPNASKTPHHVRLFFDMLQCPAWEALSNNSRILYIYMKMQFCGKECNGLPENQFYFNRATYIKTYGLYTNTTQFYTDLEQLISYGFIQQVSSGKNLRTKNVYAFSEKWKEVDVETVKKKLSDARETRKQKRYDDFEKAKHYVKNHPNDTEDMVYIATGIHKAIIKKAFSAVTKM